MMTYMLVVGPSLCTLSLVSSGACREEGKGKAASGMVLPFDPMTMTFRDLHYYVPIPKVPALHPHLSPTPLAHLN